MTDTVEITAGRVTMRLHGPGLADPAPDVHAALQRIATLILAILGPQPPTAPRSLYRTMPADEIRAAYGTTPQPRDGRTQLADQIRGIHAPGIDQWDDEGRPTHASCTACAETRWTDQDDEDDEDPDEPPLMWRTWPCPTIRALGHPWTSPDWTPHSAPERPAQCGAGQDTNGTATGPQRPAGDVWPVSSSDPTGQTIHMAPLQPPAGIDTTHGTPH